MAVSATEKERALLNDVGSRVKHVIDLLDEDGGGTISRDEFFLILENPEAIQAISDAGVDVIGLLDFADFIFGDSFKEGEEGGDEEEDEVELTPDELLDVLMQFRGANPATVKNIVDLRKYVRNVIGLQLSEIRAMLQDIDRQLEVRPNGK